MVRRHRPVLWDIDKAKPTLEELALFAASLAPTCATLCESDGQVQGSDFWPARSAPALTLDHPLPASGVPRLE